MSNDKLHRAVYWDFVFNNYTYDDVSSVKKIFREWDIFEDAGFEEEVAPTTGTKHLQGFIKLARRQAKSYLLNGPLNEGTLKSKISFRVARNWRALKAYCEKEHNDTFWCLQQERANEKNSKEHAYWESLLEEVKRNPISTDEAIVERSDNSW